VDDSQDYSSVVAPPFVDDDEEEQRKRAALGNLIGSPAEPSRRSDGSGGGSSWDRAEAEMGLRTPGNKSPLDRGEGAFPPGVKLDSNGATVASPLAVSGDLNVAPPTTSAASLVASPSAKPIPTATSPLPNELAAPVIASPIETPLDANTMHRDPYSAYHATVASPSGVEAIQKKHPILGGILRALDVGGSILAPGVMMNIPGTTLHHAIDVKRALGQGKEEAAENAQELNNQRVQQQIGSEESAARFNTPEKRRSFMQQNPELFGGVPEFDKNDWVLSGKIPQKQPGTDVGKTPEDVTLHDLMTGNNGQPRINPKTNNPYSYMEAYQDVMAAKAGIKPETQEQNKLAFQGVINKLDAAGLSTDPKNIDKSLDAGLKRGVITQGEHSTARAYQAANPTPGTNLTVHVAGLNAAEGIKKANQYYIYSDENGATHLVTGDKVPPGVDALPVKDPQTYMSEAENGNIVQKSFSKLAKDDLSIFDNGAARAVLATALSDEGARSIGLLVAGTGGSITMPSGSGKIIDQFLENHAPGMDERTKRAVKDYIADYWAIKDKMLMVQMQMQNGKMGRGNKAYFDAMVSQIPGPGTADSTMARRQLGDFNETLTELKKRYPDKFGGYKKEPDLTSEDFGSNAGTASADQRRNFSVTAGGRTYSFPDQKSLDAFKREAGIR
jgi:hypothetical protein